MSSKATQKTSAGLKSRPARAQLNLGAPPLTDPDPPAKFRRGEMTERPKVPDSKSGVPVRVPWVRIPLSPPSAAR